MPVSKVITVVESIVTKMTGNTNFITPNPPLATITTQKDELSVAAAEAENGNRVQKAAVKVKLRTLLLSMETLRAYVQTTANNDSDTAEEVALSSGMDIKKMNPRGKRVFSVINTSIPGQVKTYCALVDKATAYDFEFTATPDDENSYVSAGVKSSATRVVSDLTNGTEYFFRWCSISKDGRSAWSDPISTYVL